MECPFARKIWFGSNINIKFPEQTEYDFKEWIQEFMITKDAEMLIYTASLIYNPWFARNKFIFESSIISEDVLNIIGKNV